MRRPNILLIVMDATRFDYLSAYGYPRATSPEIERLAGEGCSSRGPLRPRRGPLRPMLLCLPGTYPVKAWVDVNENLYLSEQNRTLAEIPVGPRIPYLWHPAGCPFEQRPQVS